MELNISFEKYITHEGKNILKLIKTKTNKYYLFDMNRKEIATGRKNILKKIKEIYLQDFSKN